jgi:hypothetical protein
VRARARMYCRVLHARSGGTNEHIPTRLAHCPATAPFGVVAADPTFAILAGDRIDCAFGSPRKARDNAAKVRAICRIIVLDGSLPSVKSSLPVSTVMPRRISARMLSSCVNRSRARSDASLVVPEQRRYGVGSPSIRFRMPCTVNGKAAGEPPND